MDSRKGFTIEDADSEPEQAAPPGAADRQAAALTEFFTQLQKAMKNMRLYLHQQERFPQLLAPAFSILDEQLKAFNRLILKVDLAGFKLKETVVYEDEVSEQNMAFKLHQEGVRFLVFRGGLTLEELLDLVVIFLGATKASWAMDEDLLGQIWRRNFKNIEYVVMESYTVGSGDAQTTVSETDLENEVDQIIGHIYQSLTGRGDDQLQAARVSVEDVEIELDKIQQARAIRLGPSTITPQLVARFQDEITAEEDYRLVPKLARVLVETFADSLEPQLQDIVGNALIGLLDAFLLREDFDNIAWLTAVLAKLQAREDSQAQTQCWLHICLRLREKMSDAQRIQRVATIAETTTNTENIQKAYNYLKVLDQDTFDVLLQALETLNRAEARRVFCTVLANLGRDKVGLLEGKLTSNKPNMIRDVLQILNILDPPNLIDMVAKLLSHPNLPIRLEALKIIGSSESKEATTYLKRSLEDSDAQVRITGAQILATAYPHLAQGALLELIKRPDFRDRPPQEQVSLYGALAMTETQEAFAYFQKELEATSLLGKKRQEEVKRAVVAGLAASGTIKAFKLLTDELARGFKEPAIKAAAERACELLKKRLMSKGEET